MSTTDTTASASKNAGRPRPETPSLFDDAAQAAFRLVRLFSKQPIYQLWRNRTRSERAVELSRIVVVQAVEAGPQEQGQEMSVGMVAKRLDIDPSTASRLVAETIRDGYLSRVTSQKDGRRVGLALTEAGRELAASARQYQRSVFDQVTREWSTEERGEFARLFVKFVDAVAESRSQQAVPDAAARG